MGIKADIKSLEKRLESILEIDPGVDYSEYLNDPVGFCSNVLQVDLTPLQQHILRLLLIPPYRVLVPSANEQGKTMVAACAVIWWFLTRKPCIIRSTAPTKEQVKDLLWKEVRMRSTAAGLRLPLQPVEPRMQRSPEDFAEGKTARDEEGFKGQHADSMLFVIDEALGVEAQFWEAIETMFNPPGHAFLAIFNPTSTASYAYQQYERSKSARPGEAAWHVVTMSALDHPNVVAELSGKEKPYPGNKFGYSTLMERIKNHCRSVDLSSVRRGDFEFPPQSGKWWRPSPWAECAILARFPLTGIATVWGEQDWLQSIRTASTMLKWSWAQMPEIGADIAREGSDDTEIHVRWGPCSVDHEAFSKSQFHETATRIAEMAKKWAKYWQRGLQKLPESQRPRIPDEPWLSIPIKIDCDGFGYGVAEPLQLAGFNVVPIKASWSSTQPEYFNARTEIWFNTAQMAQAGLLDLTMLPADVAIELKRQAMAVEYTVRPSGQLKVVEKELTKAKIKRSPDGMDAMNLAYYDRHLSYATAFTTGGREK